MTVFYLHGQNKATRKYDGAANRFLRKCATEAAATRCLKFFFYLLTVDRDTINDTRSDPLCRWSACMRTCRRIIYATHRLLVESCDWIRAPSIKHQVPFFSFSCYFYSTFSVYSRGFHSLINCNGMFQRMTRCMHRLYRYCMCAVC